MFEGTDAPGVSIEEERKSSTEFETQPAIYNPNVALSIEQQRQKLPVFKVYKALDDVFRIILRFFLINF